jgi:hypothetical protein
LASEDRDTSELSVFAPRVSERGRGSRPGALSAALIPAVGEAQLPQAVEADPRHSTVEMKVNGVAYRKDIPNRTTLMQFLREDLKLTGTKMGCDRMQCGACTVIMNGRNVYSCTTLAVEAAGADVLTIEGLAKDDALHPIPAGVRRAQRLPVRLLHAGPDDEHEGVPRSGHRIRQKIRRGSR